MDRFRSDLDRLQTLHTNASEAASESDTQKRQLREDLKEAKNREQRLLNDYSELEEENIGLQKQVYCSSYSFFSHPFLVFIVGRLKESVMLDIVSYSMLQKKCYDITWDVIFCFRGVVNASTFHNMHLFSVMALQKLLLQVSNLRSAQVEFEAVKMEVKRLMDENDQLQADREEANKLTVVAQKHVSFSSLLLFTFFFFEYLKVVMFVCFFLEIFSTVGIFGAF